MVKRARQCLKLLLKGLGLCEADVGQLDLDLALAHRRACSFGADGAPCRYSLLENIPMFLQLLDLWRDRDSCRIAVWRFLLSHIWLLVRVCLAVINCHRRSRGIAAIGYPAIWWFRLHSQDA